MSEPNRYSDLEVWKALHFGGSTSGWVFYVDYAKLKDENASLKAENARLKTEVEHLMVFCNCTLIPNKELQAENARLQAEVERLTKGGDRLAELSDTTIWWGKIKKGKQP